MYLSLAHPLERLDEIYCAVNYSIACIQLLIQQCLLFLLMRYL